MNENRIVELEIKVAYQEDLLQSLNTIVSIQQQQIDRLEKTCNILNERIKSLFDNTDSKSSIQEIPPHY